MSIIGNTCFSSQERLILKTCRTDWLCRCVFTAFFFPMLFWGSAANGGPRDSGIVLKSFLLLFNRIYQNDMFELLKKIEYCIHVLHALFSTPKMFQCCDRSFYVISASLPSSACLAILSNHGNISAGLTSHDIPSHQFIFAAITYYIHFLFLIWDGARLCVCEYVVFSTKKNTAKDHATVSSVKVVVNYFVPMQYCCRTQTEVLNW